MKFIVDLQVILKKMKFLLHIILGYDKHMD